MQDFEADATRYSHVNALWLGRAADLAYRDAAAVQASLSAWGLKGRFVEAVGLQGDTQAFVGTDGAKTILAFRGTGQPLDFVTDAEFRQAPFAPARAGRGRVHVGFQSALDAAWPQVRSALDALHPRDRPLWVTGHSLGAALATLAVVRLAEEGVPVKGLYTFGSPRVGDRDFVKSFDAAPTKVFRFVNHMDAVARVPLERIGELSYAHVGTLRYFDESGALSDGPSELELVAQAAALGLESIAAGGVDTAAIATRLKVPLEDHAMARYLRCLETARTAAPRRRAGVLGWLARLLGG